MVHIDYDPNYENWDLLFDIQSGSGNYYRGTVFQRGAGIGTVLSSILRFLLPIGKTVAKEGLQTGNRALGRILQGESAIDALKAESRTAVRNLVAKADEGLKQKGMGKRHAIRHKRRGAKRSKRDILGYV